MNKNMDASYVKKLRQHFHAHPEKSMEEKETSARIQAELKELGIPFELVPPYGLIGKLEGKNPGATVMLRADMDALPMNESPTLENGTPKPFYSNVEGVAHTCGHDAHVAMLLGAAKYLSSVKDTFDGTILFCFEQGEENYGGIYFMLDALKKYKPDACFGAHVNSLGPVGSIIMGPGPRMSGSFAFKINVTGRGTHGSMPHIGVDPILTGAMMVQNIAAGMARELPPDEVYVLTFGRFVADGADNIIPNKAELSGTCRFQKTEVGEAAKTALYRIVASTADLMRAKAEISIRGELPVTENDPELDALAHKAIQEAMPDASIMDSPCAMGSETFSLYKTLAPTDFIFVGVGNTEKGINAPMHSPFFDIDEEGLAYGSAAEVAFALAFLKEKKAQEEQG